MERGWEGEDRKEICVLRVGWKFYAKKEMRFPRIASF